LTACPQLFVAVPHCCMPHAGCGTQPPQVLFVQATPPSQPPQSTAAPQLSLVMPQRLSHQCGSVEQMQRPSGVHPHPVGHGPAHIQYTPHESVPGPQRFSQNV
jgi:hypothetical protein